MWAKQFVAVKSANLLNRKNNISPYLTSMPACVSKLMYFYNRAAWKFLNI